MSDYRPPEPVSILGIAVHPLDSGDLARAIAIWSQEGRARRVYNVNVHAMNIARSNADFRNALLRADLVYCDGAGVQLAANILGKSIPVRLSVMDWIDESLDALEETRSRVYFVGDQPEVLERAVTSIRRRHPRLEIAGFHHGFFEKESSESIAVAKGIREAQPSVVFVGMGMPTQELWIEALLHQLPSSVYVPVGAAFRWYSGVQKRPPTWLRENSLEWLGRFAQEPIRLGGRYLVGNPRFLGRVLLERVRRAS